MGRNSFWYLSRSHVLCLVDLQQEVGGGAHDVGVSGGAEEGLAGEAEAEDMAVFELDDAIEAAGFEEAGLEAAEADEALGLEGGCALHAGAGRVAVAGEEEGLELGGELVLAALAGDLDGEG
jgi:hypothetical protein